MNVNALKNLNRKASAICVKWS